MIAIGYLGRRVAGARVGLLAAGDRRGLPGADRRPMRSLLTESLFGLCVAVAMLVAYRLLDRPSGWWALALGVAIGVASLARSEGLLLLPLLGHSRRVAPGRSRAGSSRRAVALACLGVALAIGPWTAATGPGSTGR